MGKTRESANLVSENNIFVDIVNDRIGVGTTNPQYKLDVSGDINFTGTFYQNSSPFVASRWTAGTGNDIYKLTGDVGIGTTNPIQQFQVGSGTSVFVIDSSGKVGIGTTNPIQQFHVGSGTSVFVIDSSGEVGIGTTNPQYTLDVYGDINFTGTFRQNGSQFVASRWTSGTGNDIYRLEGDVGIGTTNPTAALTVNGGIDGTAFESYELDDISSSTNGQDNTFIPKFNYDRVTITNPFQLLITVDGIQQSAFINNTDYVYQSNFLGSNNGYTIDADNNIKFTESVPTGSNIVARVLPVSNTPTKIKLYPFKPAEILLGY